MSEADYLEQQAADARAAMAQTAREMGQTLQRKAGEHPLVLLGAVAVAGALAARAFRPASHVGPPEESPAAPSFLGTIMTDTIQPLVQDLARTAVLTIASSLIDPPPAE